MTWLHWLLFALAILAAWTVLGAAVAIPAGRWLKAAACHTQTPGEAAATRSQPPPAPAPAARETLPPGQAGSATPRAPLPPAPPGLPGLLTGRIAYDIRVWHCGCSLMHIGGRVLGRYRCRAHADLCAWEKEFQ